MEQKKRVGIWIRVSTEFQVRDDSPEHHEQRARHYVEAKGWEVIEVYRLEAVSGKTVMELPEAKKMLRDIQTGRISALVFSKLARLARNTKELLEFSELFRKANADMISLAENIDTSSPSGRLFFTIIAAMAEWERAEIAERVAASVPIRAKMGKPLGGAAPFGYEWKGKELIVNQEEAPIRKLLHELFAEHKKKGLVAKKLNAMGYRTRNGSEFSDTTVGRLLHDSTAKGIRLANYTKSLGEGKNWVLKPESEWIQITCPAIVSEELWNTCDKILTEYEQKNKRATKTVTHLFSGILHCDCGGKMYFHPDGQKYKCNKCRKTKIANDDIEEIYFDELKIFLLSDSHFENFLSKAKQEISEKEKLLQSMSKDKKQIQSEMDKKMDLYLAGQIPKDRFGDYYNPLDIQLRQIENTIPQLEADIDILKIEELNGDTVKNEAKTMYERWHSLEKTEKRAFVERITSKITIAGDEIKIRFRYHPSYFQNPENNQHNLMDS
jgi:site-specific DNA recombinase